MNVVVLLRLFLPEVLALLQLAVKNPASVASEFEILTEIRNALNAILGVQQP
jgi:hypothetical protein